MILNTVKWSKEMFRIFDITPENFDGKPESIIKTLHPEDVSKFTNNMNRNRAVGDLPTLEYRVIHKDGSIHTIFAQARVETDNSGKPIRSIGTVKDITERKRIERELKNNLNALNETGKIAKVGGWAHNLTTGISTWTDETFRIFEIDLTENEPLLPENLNFYVPTSRIILEDALQRAIQYGESWDLELEIITTTGNQRWVHTIGKAHQENGKTESLSGAVQDITDRKQATDLLVQTQQNYETFFNTIDDLLIVLDLQGNIIHANNTAIERLGYSTEELLDNPVTMLHPAEHRDEIRKIIDGILLREVNFSPFPFLSKSGEYISIETRASHGLWNGSPAIFGVSKDITQIQISEEKFSKIFYLNPSACGLSELGTGHYLDVNEAFYKLFGFNKNEAIGKSPADLGIISPKDLKTLMLIIDSSEKVDNIEVSLIARNGDVKQVLLSADIIHIQDKKYRFTVAQDVTELKEIEHTLKISEEKYRTMLNASPDGILLIDLKGIITEVSEIGFELFDADNRDDLVGKNFYQFIPPDETNTIKDIFEKTVSEGLVQNAELKIRKKSQSTFQSEISSTLIQAPDGEPLSYMITIRDISQRKKIETKQIHADRMANLGEMASGIAHEINQPLNIISMVMDKILFETDKTETIDIEFLKTKSDKIFDNITRIRNIIDHVRAFSRSDSNYLLTAFDINSSIENAVSMITEQYKHLDINLKTQLNRQLPQIVGNTFKFEQVIVNLLTNAKDAVLERRRKQEDYCELKVEIKTYQEKQSLIVEITDNGTGVDKDDIHNIMLPFYTTKEEGKGTGLGLSICYQIIKEMNGTIDISSDGQCGTKIKLVLDIQKN
jgi:PAS domain S-box-containing protein